MTYKAQAAKYQETEILSASPGRLVVLLYDQLIVSLRRTRAAIEAGNIEQRCAAMNKSRDILMHLLGTLDREKGGEIASRLSGLYAWMIQELLDVSRSPGVARLDRVLRVAGELRDGFAQAAERAEPAGV
jgi:flagellar protein FliS